MENTKVKSFLQEMDEWLHVRAANKEPLQICLTNDYAFKKVFRNRKVAKGFLMALLNLKEKEILSIEILDPHEQGDSPEEKEGILDIKIHLNNDRKINIEMQMVDEGNWVERSLFYICKMYTEGFESGQNYEKLEQCIHVSVLDFNLLKSPEFHHIIGMMDKKTREEYSDKLLFHVVELKKLEAAAEDEKATELYRWAKVIAAKGWEVITVEAEGNQYMEEAVREMKKINQSEYERYLYLRRQMAIMDENSRKKREERMERMEKEIETKMKELETGTKELETGKKELETGKKELETGKKELETGKKGLEVMKQQIEKEKQKVEAEMQRIEEERQKAQAELCNAKAGVILELLGEYGPVPETVKAQILAQRDMEVLKRWLKSAVRVASPEEFWEHMMEQPAE